MTTALRNAILLLSCLTTTFCGPHDEEEELLADHAGGIERQIADSFGIRAVADTSIVPGAAAGYLAGTPEVTPIGEFTYRIDLDVPPGRMEPAISLNYGSRGENGLLGVGWRLDGFSEIHRCAKTFAQDGKADGIDFDDDNLCLDGRKLVAVGTAGAGGDAGTTEYRTEQDMMSRIVAKGPASAPNWFVVYRKDGHILEYFPTTAAKLVWLLYKERDYADNEIRFEYDLTAETTVAAAPDARPVDAEVEYRPSAIHYTFQRNTGDPAKRKIVFVYEPRPDPLFTYVAGVKVSTKKRLSAIEMHAPNPTDTGLVWRYALGYASDSVRSRLVRVQKCGALGGCLLAKEFLYEDPSPLRFVRAYEAAEPQVGDVHVVFDADGDGKDDLLLRGIAKKFYLRKTPAGGKAPLSMRILVRGDDNFNKVSLMDTHPVDIDADGIAELSGLVSEKEFRFFRWNANEQKLQSVWTPIPVSPDASWKKCKAWPPPEAAFYTDLDGDALPDMIKTIDVNPAADAYQPRWHYWLNQGDSFGPPAGIPLWLDPPFCYEDTRRSRPVTLDLHGDHRGALIVDTGDLQHSRFETVALRLDDSGKFVKRLELPGSGKRVYADLNHDGLQDVVAEWDGEITVWWNSGRGFVRDPSPLWPHVKDADGDWQAADVDGDGNDELLVMRGGKKPELVVFRYVPNQVVDGVLAASAVVQVIKGVPPGKLGDFNGDGFLDVACFADGKDRRLQVYTQAGGTHELLKAVLDEGNSSPRERIEYGLSYPSNSSTCRYPQQCIRRGIEVVRRHSRTGIEQRLYSYEDPRSDLHGRGFLGFGKVRVWDPDRGAETTTTYATRIRETYPYALLPKEVLEVTPILEQALPGAPLPQPATARSRIKKRVNKYQARWLHDGRSYLVHPHSWTSWEWEQDLGIDWKEEARVHIQVPSNPHARWTALRKRMGTYRSPDDGLVSAITRQAAGQPARTVSVDFGDAERVFPIRVWNDLNHTTQLSYHPAHGTLRQVIDANFVRTTRAYDDLGRLRSIHPEGGAKVTFAYEPALNGDKRVIGTRVTVRDETGSEGFVEYDRWERAMLDASRGFDGEWIHRRTDYDLLGNVSSETRPGRGAPADARTRYRYDSLDRLLETRLPDGARTRQRHTFFESRSWDAENHESYVVRDLDDRIIRSVQILGSTELPTTYQYREFDLIETITDPKGNVIEYDYDRRGRRTRLSHPDRGITTYAYNGYGELRQTTDSLSHASTYDRDVLGRVTRIEDADGVTELVWDASNHGIGNLSATTSPDGTRRGYHYDRAGRHERLDWTVDGERFSVDMAYDTLGRLSTLAYPEAPGRPRLTVRHTYNATGYLKELADSSVSPAKALWQVNSRNLDDALTRATYGNGLTTEQSYDAATGRLKGINAGSVYALAYEYDANGFAKSRSDSVKARHERFAYDSLDRLQSWRLESSSGARDTAYNFDELGNLTRVLVNGQTVEENQYGGPGAGPHALTASSVHGSFAHDAMGRRIDGGGKRIEYTEFDLPREITTTNGTTVFAYDATGTRVKKTGPAGTTISIGGLYERRTDPSGTKHVFYIEGSEGIVAQLVYDQASRTTETQYLHTDALGSIGVVTDANGQEIARRYFEPFGQRIDEHGAPLLNHATDLRVGFAGHAHDDDLGLINMRGRMFDPATRRFLTPEPVVWPALLERDDNPYAYALNNPVNMLDPSGYQVIRRDVPSGSGWTIRVDSGSRIGEMLPRPPRPSPGVIPGRWLIPNDQANVLPPQGLTFTGAWSKPPLSTPAPAAKTEVDSRSALQHVADFFRKRYADRDVLLEDLSVVAAAASFVPGPIGVAGMIASGVLGAAQMERSIATGDPWRIGAGALGALPMLGGISRMGRLVTAELGTARGAARALPAARQIEAAWGASTYRHGGLMTGIEHIMYRHSAGAGFAHVSRFAQGTTARKVVGYVDEALRYGKVTRTGPAAFTVEYNLGRVIGTNIAGKAARSIRVFVRDGIIQTAFPF